MFEIISSPSPLLIFYQIGLMAPELVSKYVVYFNLEMFPGPPLDAHSELIQVGTIHTASQ